MQNNKGFETPLQKNQMRDVKLQIKLTENKKTNW